jgi:hypothetical protein
VVVRWYYRGFLVFSVGKMVIGSMYIIYKYFPQPFIQPITCILYVQFCISDNTRILLIPPMNTTHTTQKNSGIELISIVGSLYMLNSHNCIQSICSFTMVSFFVRRKARTYVCQKEGLETLNPLMD